MLCVLAGLCIARLRISRIRFTRSGERNHIGMACGVNGDYGATGSTARQHACGRVWPRYGLRVPP